MAVTGFGRTGAQTPDCAVICNSYALAAKAAGIVQRGTAVTAACSGGSGANIRYAVQPARAGTLHVQYNGTDAGSAGHFGETAVADASANHNLSIGDNTFAVTLRKTEAGELIPYVLCLYAANGGAVNTVLLWLE